MAARWHHHSLVVCYGGLHPNEHTMKYDPVALQWRHLSLMASEIVSNSIVCPTYFFLTSIKGNKKCQLHRPCLREIYRWSIDSPHKGPIMYKTAIFSRIFSSKSELYSIPPMVAVLSFITEPCYNPNLRYQMSWHFRGFTRSLYFYYDVLSCEKWSFISMGDLFLICMRISTLLPQWL